MSRSTGTVTVHHISACSGTGELNNEEEIRDQQTQNLQRTQNNQYVITVPFNVIQWHFQDTITGDYRSELTGLDYPHEALCFVETADTTET